MKKISWGICLIWLTLLGLSCKKKDSAPPSYQWYLGPYGYSRAASTQKFDIMSGGDTLHVISVTSNDSDKHGAFSGSGLACSFILLGEGNYEVTSKDTALAHPTSKYIYLTCSVGTMGTSGTNFYVSQPSTVKAVVEKINDQYTVTIDTAVNFVRTLRINGGVTGASESYTFTCNEVY